MLLLWKRKALRYLLPLLPAIAYCLSLQDKTIVDILAIFVTLYVFSYVMGWLLNKQGENNI